VAIISAVPGGCEVGQGRIDLAFVARSQHAQFAPDLLRRGLGVPRFAFRVRIAGIDQHGERSRGRHLAQKLQPLWRQLVHEQRDTGDVAAGMAQTGNQAVFDRVVADRDHNRDDGSSALGRKGGDRPAHRYDDGDRPAYQILGEHRQFVVLPRRPSELDGDILPFDVAGVFEAIAKCRDQGGKALGRGAAEKPDHRHSRLLSANRQRPGDPRAGQQDQQVASVHSMTSSARARIDGGTVRPSALAVFRLTTSSKVVGCSTGRSAGLVPLRIFPA
jgi:hypothetical protein